MDFTQVSVCVRPSKVNDADFLIIYYQKKNLYEFENNFQ